MPAPQEIERVDAESLGASTILGSGGQGTVRAVADRLIDDSWPAVYKEFAPAVHPALDEAALLAMVRFRRALPADAVQRLDDVAAWPAVVVERDGVPCGFLMRRVPDAFVIGLGMPSGPTRHLAQMQLLLNDAAYLKARGLIVDDRFRLELLHDAARAMEFFHAHGLVVGDLSPTNLLFSRERRPRCFFLDCDAMRLRGASALRQAETIDWQAPTGAEQLATRATDSYKFALLCIRLFAGDQGSRDPAALDRAGAAVEELATRALSVDPRRRPAMAEWRAALGAAAAPRRARGRSRGALAAAAVLVAALVFLVLRLSSCIGLAGTDADGRTRASEQAGAVAQVLVDSGRARSRVANAVRQVAACTDVRTAGADLRAGSAARRATVERAGALRTDLLPRGAELKAQIVVALAHDQRAGDAYATWAAAVELTGCRSAAMHGADRRAGDAESRAAIAAKKRVAELWKPLAAEYGQPAMSYQDI
jgi:hypothetical protein